METKIVSKRSEYNVYRELKFQEELNRKDKYDNRLYLSLRYKSGYHNVPFTEILPRNENLHKFSPFYRANRHYTKRGLLLNKSMLWGTNKYGDKKVYNIARFHEAFKYYPISLAFFGGVFSAYIMLALYYKKLEHDLWMFTYGDYFPQYERIGNFTIRSKIPYYFHSWKLVSVYNFSKYDLTSVNFPTGMKNVYNLEYVSRQMEYRRKRDKTFDFMQIGEDDFHNNWDGFV